MFLNLDRQTWKHIIFRVILVAIGSFMVLYYGMPKEKKVQKHDKDVQTIMFTAMSTFFSAQLATDAKKYPFDHAFDTIRYEFRKVEKVCNYFDPASELSRLNATAHEKPFVCSKDLWEIITLSREWYKKTDGAFDITITPLMKLWGFYTKNKKIPSEAEIQAAKKLCGLDKVKFDDEKKTVFFPVKGMSLNFGGIAKGWALDRAVAGLQKRHPEISEGFLNLGGNVITFGGEFKGGVRDPFDKKKVCAQVDINGSAAMSTSGNMERYVTINGKQYGHIMNPATGRPVSDRISVTVLTDKGVESDALSTAIFIKGYAFAAKFPSVKTLVIQKDAKDPEKLDIRQTGDCWTFDLPASKVKLSK